MARTPLAQHLAQLCARAVAADRANNPTASALSRREFLGRAGQIGLGALAGSALLDHAADAAAGLTGPVGIAYDIVIVGAGLAGLTCAYELKKQGTLATVYEAASGLAGRCRTLRGFFDDGQIAERGGEFIDTGHTALRKLAAEFGLEFDNVKAAEKPGSEPFYYFDGARYSTDDVFADFQAVLPKLKSDVHAAGYPTLYNQSTPRGAELDAMSIDDWISESVPGGLESRFGRLLQVAYTIEYGAETSDQSALNLLYLLGYTRRDELELFGESDEKFHLHGGNDRLVKHLAKSLPCQIEFNMALTAIALNDDGRYTLTFNGDPNDSSAGFTTIARHVVLALPFSVMRARVDYSRAGFSARKQTAIEQLGMGTSTKLHVQFTDRVWRKLGGNGDSYADTGYQNTWESSRAQAGQSGLLVDFTGGEIGASFDRGTPEERAAEFLTQIEPVYPGSTEQWNGKATVDYWTGNPLTLGAYSYWKVGQYTQFAGVEGEPEGNCHFAGEHTSINFQGFLNGAVQTGKRAAREVLAEMGMAAN